MTENLAPLIDTHAHLNQAEFEHDLEEVIERAWAAGLVAIISVGYDYESCLKNLQLADNHERIYAAVGIQPNTAENAAASWEKLIELASHPKVVAIGEIGMDFYHKWESEEVQVSRFRKQLEIARKINLPVVIHSRSAVEACIDIIKKDGLPQKGGVMHSLECTASQAETIVDLGLYISLNGMATWSKRSDLREMARSVPIDRLLLETDCPYLSPKGVGGKRNEPAFIRRIAELLAKTLGLSQEGLSRHTSENAKRLFGLPITF